jgi:hypothetical protein
MLQRSVLPASFLGLAILALCSQSRAQDPTAQKDSQKPVPMKPAKQAENPPASPEEQIYEQTKRMLLFFEQDTLQRQKLIAGKLLGRACDPRLAGCDQPGVVTQKNVDGYFEEILKGIRDKLANLESLHQDRMKDVKYSKCIDQCRVFYELAVDGAQIYWPGQSWLATAMDVLFTSASKVHDNQEAVREQFKDELSKKENLSSEQQDAALAEFDRKQSQERKATFEKIVPEFRSFLILLGEDRKKLIQQLWCMYDLAEQNHDAESAAHVKKALQDRDTNNLDLNGDIYFQFFGNDDWCKQHTYPDFEKADSEAPCNRLWTDLLPQPSVDVLRPKTCPGTAPTPHKPLEVKEWTAEGAAEGERP